MRYQFSDEIGLTAAGWVNRLMRTGLLRAGRVERPPAALENWLASDAVHRHALRAMMIAAYFLKAARPNATADDHRELEVAILGEPPTLTRSQWT
jgi:hypothetical protein